MCVDRLLAATLLAAPAAVLLAAPAQAATTGSPCDSLPGPARLACRGAAAISGGVGGAVDSAVSSVGSSAVDGLASAFADAGGFFLGRLGDLLTATTRTDVGADWFVQRYALVFGMSAVLTFGLLLLTVVKAVVRGQGLEVLRAGTVHYLYAVLASAFAPALVYLLLQVSDAVSSALALGGSQDTKSFLTSTGTTLAQLSSTNPAGGAATVLIAAVFTILCSVVLWVELLLRTAIIYVATLFAAPTFSGLVDRNLWKHARRWVYFVTSVVFAKPVVIAVLGLAAAGASGGSTADGFSSVFVALALMLVAIFCVGLLFRLVPNAGDQIAGALSARRELKAGLPSTPLPSPTAMVRQSMQTHLVRGASRSAMATTAAVAAPTAVSTSAHRVAGPAVRAGAAPAGPSSAPKGADA